MSDGNLSGRLQSLSQLLVLINSIATIILSVIPGTIFGFFSTRPFTTFSSVGMVVFVGFALGTILMTFINLMYSFYAMTGYTASSSENARKLDAENKAKDRFLTNTGVTVLTFASTFTLLGLLFYVSAILASVNVPDFGTTEAYQRGGLLLVLGLALVVSLTGFVIGGRLGRPVANVFVTDPPRGFVKNLRFVGSILIFGVFEWIWAFLVIELHKVQQDFSGVRLPVLPEQASFFLSVFVILLFGAIILALTMYIYSSKGDKKRQVSGELS